MKKTFTIVILFTSTAHMQNGLVKDKKADLGVGKM